MHASNLSLKPFRFTKGSFAGSQLLRRFEARTGLQGSVTSRGTGIRGEGEIGNSSLKTNTRSAHGAAVFDGYTTNNAGTDMSIPLALPNRRTNKLPMGSSSHHDMSVGAQLEQAPALSIADRVAAMYTRYIHLDEARQRHLQAAESALIGRMSLQSHSENNRTWEHLKEQYGGVYDFSAVDEMNNVFVNKELRVIGGDGGSTVSASTPSFGSTTPTCEKEQETPRGRRKEKSTKKKVPAKKRERQPKVAPQVPPTRVVDSATLEASSCPILPLNANDVQHPSPDTSALTQSPQTTEEDEDAIVAAAIINPLMRLPTALCALPIIGAPVRLETLVDPMLLVAVKESQQSKEQAQKRRRRKLCKALEGASPKTIAHVLSDSLGTSELEVISKTLVRASTSTTTTTATRTKSDKKRQQQKVKKQ